MGESRWKMRTRRPAVESLRSGTVVMASVEHASLSNISSWLLRSLIIFSSIQRHEDTLFNERIPCQPDIASLHIIRKHPDEQHPMQLVASISRMVLCSVSTSTACHRYQRLYQRRSPATNKNGVPADAAPTPFLPPLYRMTILL
jgi:hypothetical protein